MYLSGAPHIPRVRPQLLNDILGKSPPATAGDDCNIKVTQACCEFGAGVYPSVADVRAQMGQPSGGTSTQGALRAMRHYGCTAELLDANFSALEDAWQDRNTIVSIACSYRRVNSTYPQLSGSPTFNGFHRVLTWGWEQLKQGGPRFIVWDDPTHDFRNRDGENMPKGPLWVKRAWIEDVMIAPAIQGGQLKDGYFSAIAVQRA